MQISSFRIPCLIVASTVGLFSSAIAAEETKPPPDPEFERNAELCVGGGSIAPDASIAACSALINGGQLDAIGLASALNNRGAAYKQKNDLDKALADYNQSIAIKADFPDTYYNRGRLYLAKKQYDLAIRDFSEALRLKPDFVAALNGRGAAYGGKAEFEKALADFEAVLKLQPENETAKRNRNDVKKRLGK